MLLELCNIRHLIIQLEMMLQSYLVLYHTLIGNKRVVTIN